MNDRILKGWVLIHKIPPDLVGNDASAQRVEWMRPMIEAALRAEDEEEFTLEDFIGKDESYDHA